VKGVKIRDILYPYVNIYIWTYMTHNSKESHWQKTFLGIEIDTESGQLRSPAHKLSCLPVPI